MRQRTTQRFWFGSLILILALVAGACAPTASPPAAESAAASEESAAAPAESGKKVLRFYTSNGDHALAANDFMIRKFQESHPDFEIEIEYGGDQYADKVFTMAAAGNLPDIMYTADIYTAPFVDAGVLLDMQPFADVDEEVDIDDAYESILGLGRVEGDPGLYMIPTSLDNVQVYYNKTMWEAAGAPLPHPDWTWDEFITSCKMVQEAHPDSHCVGIGGTNGGGGFDWWAYLVPWIRGYGGDVLSEDGTQSTLSSPESLAGIQAYADLWVEHDVAIPLGSDLGGNCFINQKCATWLSIPIFAGVFRDGIEPGAFEWDVEFIPGHPEGRFTGMGTFGYSVSSGTQYPEEAWDFVKVLISPEGQETMLRTYRAAPLLQSMAESEVFGELEPPPAEFRRVFVEGQQFGILPRTYPVECGSLYTGQVNTAIRAALESVIRGQGTAADVFPGVDAEIQACLDRAAE